MIGVKIKGNYNVGVEEVAIPDVGSHQVIIQTEASTICGSDLHFYRSPSIEMGNRVNFIAGHDGSGIVHKIGDHVENIKVGDRVAIFHRYGCGVCENCIKGWPQYCKEGKSTTLVMGQSVIPWKSSGTFAEYILCPSDVCFKIPDSINFEAGSIIGCNGITAYSIITKLGIKSGDIVGIFGLGPLGITASMILNGMGAIPIGIDLSLERRKLAEKLGLPYSANNISKLGDSIDIISHKRYEIDVTIDFTGNSNAINDAIRIVKPLGKVGLVGIGPGLESTVIKPTQFLEKGVTISGILVGNIHNMYDIIRFVDKHNIDFSKMITDRFKLSEAIKAFTIAEKGTEGKIAFIK